jgi:hypothetical protein
LSTYLPHLERWRTRRLSASDFEDLLGPALRARGSYFEVLLAHRDLPEGLQRKYLRYRYHEPLSRNPGLAPEVEAALLDVNDMTVLRNLAFNPGLSVDGQRELLKTSSLREAVAKNPSFDAGLRDELVLSLQLQAYCHGPNRCACWTLEEAFPGRARRGDYRQPLASESWALALEHPGLHLALASVLGLPADLAHQLLDHPFTQEHTYRLWAPLASAGNVPADRVDSFLTSSLSFARGYLAKSPGPEELLDRLLDDALESDDWEVFQSMAANPRLPARFFERLVSAAPNCVAMGELAANPSLPPALQEEVLRVEASAQLDPAQAEHLDLWAHLPRNLARNPSASPSALTRVFETSFERALDAAVLPALLANPGFDLEAHLLDAPVSAALEGCPLALFGAADAADLDPETFDSFVDGFDGSVKDLFDVVSDFAPAPPCAASAPEEPLA